MANYTVDLSGEIYKGIVPTGVTMTEKAGRWQFRKLPTGDLLASYAGSVKAGPDRRVHVGGRRTKATALDKFARRFWHDPAPQVVTY